MDSVFFAVATTIGIISAIVYGLYSLARRLF